MTRIYQTTSIFDLEGLVESRKHDPAVLRQVLAELNHRKTQRAARLRKEVEDALGLLDRADRQPVEASPPFDEPAGGSPGPGRRAAGPAATSDRPRRANAAPATTEGHDEEHAVPLDDRRRPDRTVGIRPPGTAGLPDAWTPPLETTLVLSTPPTAPRPTAYVEALTALVAEIKRTGAGQKRYDLENGALQGNSGSRTLYGFAFTDEADLFEDAQVELEALGRRLDATIVTISDGRLVVGVAEDLGAGIKKATLVVDATALLTALKERLESARTDQLTLNKALADAVVGDVRAPAVDTPIPPIAAEELNEAQRKAFHAALERPVTYIWGPPGCGKTQTLAPIVRAAFEAEKRVLVCSNTNRAVDQVLYKICKELGQNHPAMQDGRVLRVGTIADDKLRRDFETYVTRDGIVARLSADLRRRQEELQAAIASIDRRAADARRTLERFADFDRQNRVVETTEQRADQAAQEGREREPRLLAQQGLMSKLLEEQSSPGRFFGLFKRGAQAIGNDIAQCEMRIRELENTIRDQKALSQRLRSELAPARERRDRLARDLAGLNRKTCEAEVATADDAKRPLLAELREVENRIADLADEITRNARILGVTCTKAYLSAKDLGQADLVVIDEASMVTLPVLWFCAGLSRERVVVCGDFRQIPPIVTTREQAIVETIGNDVFAAKGIDRADHPELMMLDEQFRMDDAICRLLTDAMYDGRLVTSAARSKPEHPSLPQPFEGPLVLIDTSDLWPFESTDAFFSRFNLMHALLVRNIAWHCQRSGFLRGGESLGVCTPYAAQARLTRELLRDEGLEKVQVGTVHRFQGDERNAVILDIPESHGGSFRLGHFVQGIPPSSTGARLINVALSRAQNHAIVIANLTHLDRQLPSSALLRDVLHRMQDEGRVVSGTEVLALRPLQRDLAGLFGAIQLEADDSKLGLFDQGNFDAAFEADIRNAESSVVIFSGFVTPRRVAKLGDLLRAKVAAGVAVRCVTRPPHRNGSMRPDLGKTALDMLEGIGCVVDCRANIHEKIVIIDRRIVWHGSLNALSHAHLSDESMTRLASEAFAGAVAAKMSKRPYGPDKALAMLTQPENPRCGDCDSRTVFMEGRFGPYFACETRCGWSENLRQSSGAKPTSGAVPADLPKSGPPCPDCGGEMRIRSGRYGLFYGCANYPSCRGRVQVKTKGKRRARAQNG